MFVHLVFQRFPALPVRAQNIRIQAVSRDRAANAAHKGKTEKRRRVRPGLP